MAAGSLEVLAPGTANLSFGRVTLAPGASVPFAADDPSAALIYIAAGEVTFQVQTPMTVARGAKAGTPVPTAPEQVAAGTAFTLRDGDSALFPPAIAGEARNAGSAEAVAWVVTVAVFSQAGATPTP
jgi:hypothetical protein